MIPTFRLLLLVFPALLFVAGATAWPGLGFAGAVWLFLSAVITGADRLFTPGPAQVRVTRRCSERLSLGDENTVTVEVSNASSRPLRIQTRDEFPEGFVSSALVVHGTVAPGATTGVTYTLRPHRRGNYRFGALNLRYRSRLGLFWRQTRTVAPLEVRVYPSILDIRKYDLLVRRGRLYEAGLVTSRLQGVGTEFERLRDYLPDDDYRRVNWKATARVRRPITVEYDVERAQNVVILLDQGRLMGAPVGELDKLDHAVKAALMLAYVVLLRGDRVGLLAFADRVNVFLPPDKGKIQLHSIIEHLYAVRAQPSEPSYDAAFRRLASSKLRRSLIVVLTDLIDAGAAERLVRTVALLSRHHLVLCATLADPAVHQIAATLPATSRGVYETAVAQRLLTERREALELLRRGGAIVVDVPADKLVSSVVNRYLEMKASGRL